MITRHLIEQDLELQRCAATPQEMKPRFNWSDMASSQPAPATRILVQVGNERTDLSIAKIAETVGRAVTDLALSRKEDDIFNESNRQLVSNIVRAVTDTLSNKANPENTGGTVLLTASELTSVIEIALVRQNAHDVAKSLLIRRKTMENARRNPRGTATERPLCRVIRRNGEVVAWDANKIEIAVRSAFLSLGMDSSPAREVSTAVTERIICGEQKFIRLEEIQDCVQEELMRQGHYKVAESYILYRAHRAQLRELTDDYTVCEEGSVEKSISAVLDDDVRSDLSKTSDVHHQVEETLTKLGISSSSVSINLSYDLERDARTSAVVAQRSIAGQIEFWARLGRSIEPVLRGDRAMALQQAEAVHPLSEIIGSIDTDAGRERVRTYLESRPFPHFEACPEEPELLVKIAEDGGRTRGRFVNRVFVEVK